MAKFWVGQSDATGSDEASFVGVMQPTAAKMQIGYCNSFKTTPFWMLLLSSRFQLIKFIFEGELTERNIYRLGGHLFHTSARRMFPWV